MAKRLQAALPKIVKPAIIEEIRLGTNNTADVESGMIVKEAYKGFTYKGKVIRYSQVIVKK